MINKELSGNSAENAISDMRVFSHNSRIFNGLKRKFLKVKGL
jgi:hypothetical protein